ncbi:DUF1698 domain-containing protein [bacterium]|nr:DUF1698 domain-containing protein [bacterium]
MISDRLERLRSRLERRIAGYPVPPSADAQRRAGEPPRPRPAGELRARADGLAPWYQRVYLGSGVHTLEWPHAAHHETVWAALEPALPADLRGLSVLDVGANAGWFSLRAKRRGARRVVGLEPDPRYLAQAELCREAWDADVEYRALGADDLGSIEESFDVVLATGLLYHLRHPLLALERIADLCRDAVVVETEVVPARRRQRIRMRLGPPDRLRIRSVGAGFMKFVEGDELNGDPSNWWVPDTECVRGMLRAAGFRHLSRPCYLEATRLLLVASKAERSALDLDALGRASATSRG